MGWDWGRFFKGRVVLIRIRWRRRTISRIRSVTRVSAVATCSRSRSRRWRSIRLLLALIVAVVSWEMLVAEVCMKAVGETNRVDGQ